jgi:hypothetical protein
MFILETATDWHARGPAHFRGIREVIQRNARLKSPPLFASIVVACWQ